jgi:hypothetical protein
MADIAEGVGPSDRVARYRVPDDELAVGSTLGGQKVIAIAKATGALQNVYSVDLGKTLFGTVGFRYYDADAGIHLAQQEVGTFLIHTEHQEHLFNVPGDMAVHEDFFVLRTEVADPPAVYLTCAVTNESAHAREPAIYVYADLRGDTESDVEATYDEQLGALIAWNGGESTIVRIIGASEKPHSHETTQDYAKAIAGRYPGGLSNATAASGAPLGALLFRRVLAPGETWSLSLLLTFSAEGMAASKRTFHACPAAEEALARTMHYYRRTLSQSVVLTPNPVINRGVLWAKANMLRVEMLAPTGWCFTNDPTRSNNSVGRDTAWFAFGSDYLTPEFSRESLLAYVRLQEECGMIIEYYDIRNGKTEDYGLNINDNTPLLILALWRHYNATGDRAFLADVYPAASKAARYIIAQENEQGLVWCTATGTGDWGIIGWRNVIQNYTLNGATTEVNAECYAALLMAAQMAHALEHHEDSVFFREEADKLKRAINTHLYNPEHGLYYLNIGLQGQVHTDVTSDLVFPAMFGVADEQTSVRIVNRLSNQDFWTASGMRTTPRDAPNYTPDGGSGLLGGVWVGVAFWFAFAAARYNPSFMDDALAISFQNYSRDPRRSNTVPGQFSEWLHGETLVNQGMMLSPWYPPRYLWAAIEGAGGLELAGEDVRLHPRLAPQWNWMGLQHVPYRGKQLTWFVARIPDVQVYANFHFQGSVPYTAFDADITDRVQAIGDNICVVAFRDDTHMLICVGSTADHAVTTAVCIHDSLSGSYRVRAYHSIVAEWMDEGLLPAARLASGLALHIGGKGFYLLDLRQET